jgi:PAS domain S-box-containing protein
VLPEDRLRVKIALAGVIHGSDHFAKTYRVRGADTVVRWVSARGYAEHDESQALIRFTGQLTDITDQKRVEEQLHIAQTAGGVGTFEHTDGFGTVEVSAQFCRLLGLQPTDALPVRTINAVGSPDDPSIIQGGGGGGDYPAYAEMRIRRADTGEARWLARRGEHRRDAAVGVGGGRFIGVIYDITAAKDAEADLRELARALEDRVEERTRERDRVWNRSRDLFFVMSRDRRYIAINPAWTALLGYEEADLIGHSNVALGLTHPDEAEYIARLVERLDAGEAQLDYDARLKAKNGEYRLINWAVIPEGDLLYGTGRDITDRRQLEDQLRQSQKMEAVGQLTGGLAHDFNNMLTGVIGGVDLARRRMGEGRMEDATRYLEAATAAAQRAAALTHRLLAFSRRQTLDPRAIDVNDLMVSIEDLLRRTLGEQIRLELHLAPGIDLTRADANQLESAVLNLAINARDAMPDGGVLTISTANVRRTAPRIADTEAVPAGDYISIAVADTGCGMSEQTLAKVFDPFFTTKPQGQGTGLGLSMVYGFVRQSGGHIAIESKPDAGACVTLMLPRFEGAADPDEQASDVGEAPRGGGERVLLVEDDPQVRMLVRAVLDDLGYVTAEAVDGVEALKLAGEAPRFDLLITDVGLPGFNGRQLADALRAQHPDLPILFMTGYAANVTEKADMLATGMSMINKPFALDTLARTIREILAGAATGRAAC